MAVILSRLFSRISTTEQKAGALYIKVVEHSRLLPFYDDFGVADTVEGRYDMLALHAFIVLHRLRGQGDEADEIAQMFFDVMFRDMDTNLREMGIGDMGVSRRVPKMAEALYGRAQAYEEALALEGNEALAEALDRNLYRKNATAPENLQAMAHYLRQQMAHVATQPVSDLLDGKLDFIDPPQKGQA